MDIDLRQFCGDDPFRPYLHKPFSVSEFTYATNGHIMVRVARRGDAPEQTEKGHWDKPFVGYNNTTFARPNVKLPPHPSSDGKECSACDGRGREHECPDCECECEFCNGTGKVDSEARTSTTLSGLIVNLRYARMVLSLPAVEIATEPTAESPILFRFDGGIGALMPMSCKYIDHVEIAIAA